jgi:hypothetical protein
MKQYNSENHAKNLPDIYKKTPTSNNYKLLEIGRLSKLNLRNDLANVDHILLLDNATGKTLDLYGERIGQRRGKASDALYLIMIKAKMMRAMSNGSYNSVIGAMSKTFDCDPSDIVVKEADVAGAIDILSVPISVINKAGLSSKQAHQIIVSLLPIGIRLDQYLLEGTFCFSDSEDEYDEDAGFAFEENADVNDVGGYLGVAGSDISDELLPI